MIDSAYLEKVKNLQKQNVSEIYSRTVTLITKSCRSIAECVSILRSVDGNSQFDELRNIDEDVHFVISNNDTLNKWVCVLAGIIGITEDGEYYLVSKSAIVSEDNLFVGMSDGAIFLVHKALTEANLYCQYIYRVIDKLSGSTDDESETVPSQDETSASEPVKPVTASDDQEQDIDADDDFALADGFDIQSGSEADNGTLESGEDDMPDDTDISDQAADTAEDVSDQQPARETQTDEENDDTNSGTETETVSTSDEEVRLLVDEGEPEEPSKSVSPADIDTKSALSNKAILDMFTSDEDNDDLDSDQIYVKSSYKSVMIVGEYGPEQMKKEEEDERRETEEMRTNIQRRIQCAMHPEKEEKIVIPQDEHNVFVKVTDAFIALFIHRSYALNLSQQIIKSTASIELLGKDGQTVQFYIPEQYAVRYYPAEPDYFMIHLRRNYFYAVYTKEGKRDMSADELVEYCRSHLWGGV